MLPDLPPFLQKLWDKGIDISASVITSVIITLIALAAWRVKLRLDLKAEEAKQRQQHRISEELAAPVQAREAAERRRALRTQCESLANAVAEAGLPRDRRVGQVCRLGDSQRPTPQNHRSPGPRSKRPPTHGETRPHTRHATGAERRHPRNCAPVAPGSVIDGKRNPLVTVRSPAAPGRGPEKKN